ncbi:MAG: tetratricopeptide repeat protein [Candidatus Thorarchaeota archaeon]|nr:MAG: tetratricopeptide repeat protein [Candidatus Thorarchaeota archaeon]
MKKTREQLSQARKLFENGEYHGSLELIESMKGGAELSSEELCSFALLECQVYAKLGELPKILAISEEMIPTLPDVEDVLLRVDILVERAQASWRSGKYDVGIAAVEMAEEFISTRMEKEATEESEDTSRRRLTLLRHKGILYWYQGKLDRAIECHEKSMEIAEKLTDTEGIASALNNLGLVHWSKGNLQKAIELYRQGLAIREELGGKPEIAILLNNLGNVHTLTGDLDKALDYHQQALEIRSYLGNDQDIVTTLINIGSIYQMKGLLDKARSNYERSLEISKERGFRSNEALALNNLGSIYSLTGELELALDCLTESLKINEELGNRQEIALALINLGAIHQRSGDSEIALEEYKRGLMIYEEVGNEHYIAITLYYQLSLALELEDQTRSKYCLERLKDINERTENRVIDQRYRVARAMSLKASKRVRDKMKAQEIFEEVVDEEVADHTLTVTAMIHLCDLLLVELKISEEEAVISRIMDLTGRLHEIAKQQSSHSLLVETYLLQAKLAMIELDLDRARIILAQAHIAAEERGLRSLSLKVAHERELLQSQLSKWETLVEQNPSTKDMIGMTRLDNLLERMVRKTVAVLTDEEKKTAVKEIRGRDYSLEHFDHLEQSQGSEKSEFRVGVAQIGVSQNGDILGENYDERAPGLFGIREDQAQLLWSKALAMIKKAHQEGVNILLFPELTIDLNYSQFLEEIVELAKVNQMYIIPGSFHDSEQKRNVSVVVGPDGVVWEQEKHIPAMIHFEGRRIKEGILTSDTPRKTIVCDTEYGRIAIAICRDFLDMDLRVELKNFEPPVDLILNPAFTPVTADFEAVHFDARRSIYAYCFFANVAEFGDSRIYTPEKERAELRIPTKEEGLIFKDVDLFRLRSERKKWEIEQKKHRLFIQSTR